MSEGRTNPFPGLRPFKFHEHELFFGREEQYEEMIAKLSGTRFLAVVGTSGSGKSSLVRAGLLPALYGGQMMSAGPRWRIAVFRPKDDPIREFALALNHRRVFGDRSKENGSSLFKLTESIDWSGLCSKVSEEARKDNGPNPGGRILEVLSSQRRQVLAGAAGDEDIEDKAEVVQTFNEILKRRDFYQATDFQRVPVTGEARELLSQNQDSLSDYEIEKANRLLLEASYPQEIAKKGEIQAQITEVTLRRGDLGLIEAAREAKMLREENLLVVVDQFEELFRYAKISEHGPHGNQAAAFVKLLLEASAQKEIPIYVVLTMRSDYLGDCAKFWDLPEAINSGQYLIPRLTRDQRREAIKGPIKLRGADITPQLVNQLLNDMGDDPDQLPILQHALMRTWDKWEKDHKDGELLDVRHYVEIGRMAKALSMHADEAYEELPDERSRWIAQQVFKCLTERGASHRETRRPTSIRDIRAVTNAKLRELVPVINVFRQEGRSFVLPSPKKPLKRETLIDISHESLIRNWTKLKEWVGWEARSANIYRRLVETATLHERGKAGLLSDLEVEYALNWKKLNKPNLAWASRYHSDLEARQKTYPETANNLPFTSSDEDIFNGAMAFLEKSQKARRKKAQLRKISTVLIAASVVLVLGFLWAMWQIKGINQENRLKARLAYGAEMNLAQREFEVANFADVNQLLQAPKSVPAPSGFLNRFEWYRRLLSPNDILKQDASLRGFEWSHLWALSHDESSTLGEYDCRVLTVAALNKPNLIATATRTRRIDLWDASKGNKLTTPEGISEDISTVAFAPDGRSVAIGKQDGSIAVELSDDFRRTTRRRELATLQAGRLPSVNSIAYSPDGKFLAVGTQDGAVTVWETSDFNIIQKVKTDAYDQVVKDPEPVSSVAFSSDSRVLAIGHRRFATLVDTTTWRPMFNADLSTTIPIEQRASTEPAPPTCLAFSPDGKTLAMGRSDKSITLWDLIENKYLASLVGHSMEVLTVAFSDKDEGVMASGSRDGGIKLWDAKKFSSPDYRRELSERIASLNPNSKPNSTANISPNESMTTAAIRHKSDSEVSNELIKRTLNGHAGAVTTLAFLPNKGLVSGSEDKTVKLWTVDKDSTATVKLGQPSKVGVSSLAFSPNGEWLAAGKYDGSAVIWNTSKKVSADDKGAELERNASAVSSVAFSPDGQILATAGYDKTVTLWQMSSPKRKLRVLTGHLGAVLTMAFSPKGETLATGSSDKTVRLWDVKTGRSTLVTTIDKGDAVLSLAFGGRILAVGTSANTVILWDLDGAKEVRRLEGHSDAISSVAFSPDGSIVATGSWDTTAKLWDAQTGQELATLQGHSKRVLSLSFFPTGNRLVTGGEDGSVRLWDMSYERGEKSTRRALVSFTETALVPAVAVAFSPDKQTLATGNGDGTVLLRYAAPADQIINQSQPAK